MSHYAKIVDGIVECVIVAEADVIAAMPGTWIQTSYNTRAGAHKLGGNPFRKNFAGIGYMYDENRNAFIPPPAHPSWILNEDTCIYDAPTPRPNNGKRHFWNESTTQWIEIDNQGTPVVILP